MHSERHPDESVDELVGESMRGIVEESARHTAAQREEAERRAQRSRRRRLAAAVLVPACLLLTALNLAGFRWLAQPEPPSLSRAEARSAALRLLSDAVDELQVYFEQNRAYPQVPAFIGPDGPEGDDEPFTYELLGPRRYTLSVTLQGETVSFDSRQDPAELFREVRDGR